MRDESLFKKSHLAFLRAPTDLLRRVLYLDKWLTDLEALYLEKVMSCLRNSLKRSEDIQGRDFVTLHTLVGT